MPSERRRIARPPCRILRLLQRCTRFVLLLVRAGCCPAASSPRRLRARRRRRRAPSPPARPTTRIAALNEARGRAATTGRAAFLQALLDDAVKVAGGKVFVVDDGKARRRRPPAPPATLPDGAEDVVNNNRMRGELEAALAALQLFSPSAAERARGRRASCSDQADEAQAAADREGATPPRPTPALKAQLGLLRAAVLIVADDQAKRLEAAKLLARAATSRRRKTLLLERLSAGVETDAEVRGRAAARARQRCESRLAWGERARRAVHRRQPRLDPAAGRARAWPSPTA